MPFAAPSTGTAGALRCAQRRPPRPRRLRRRRCPLPRARTWRSGPARASFALRAAATRCQTRRRRASRAGSRMRGCGRSLALRWRRSGERSLVLPPPRGLPRRLRGRRLARRGSRRSPAQPPARWQGSTRPQRPLCPAACGRGGCRPPGRAGHPRRRRFRPGTGPWGRCLPPSGRRARRAWRRRRRGLRAAFPRRCPPRRRRRRWCRPWRAARCGPAPPVHRARRRGRRSARSRRHRGRWTAIRGCGPW